MKLPKGIRQRGSSFLVDVTVNGIRKTETVASIDEAKAIRAALEAQLRGNVISLPNGQAVWTLQKAYEKTLALAWEGSKNEVNSARNAREVVKFFGPEIRLDSINCDRIDELVAYFKKVGNNNSTINRKLAALSKMLTIAMDRGGLSSKPSIHRQKEGVGRIRFLTQSEEDAFLSVLNQWGKDEQAEAFCVLIDTGLRPSELWRVEGRDVHEEAGTLTIWESKTDRSRTVPMTTRVREILVRRKELSYSPNSRNYTTKLFPYDNFWFEYTWNRVKTHLEMDGDLQFIPYALRHTCASRLVQRGVDIRIVKDWMGHTTITTTMRYAHLCPKNLLEAVKVLEAV